MARLAPLVLLVLAVLLPGAQAAVFTVDFGSEWMKVAVVSPRLKPDPIAIAINEMSKRKSPALVAISQGERLVSEEAAAIAARYPERVYTQARDLLGVPLEAAEAMLKASYAGYSVTGPPPDDGRDADPVPPGSQKVWVKTHDGQVYHAAEELVGIILEYAQHLAESTAKFEVVDAVVSVPPYFSQSQRQAILDAALLVGVNVMALIHEHSGAALQYGMFLAKELEQERDVLLYDMGATSTYAAVLHFSQYTAKDRGKNVTNPQFQVKGVRWDHALGGQTLETRLVEHFVKEVNAKLGGGVDVRSLPKSMAKLRKAVKRTKEILSANSEAPIHVDSVYEETDFRSSITREKFEELCGDLWARALVPLREVLQETQLQVQDLYAVELIGGGTRVPKVQAVLQEFLGPNKTLDRHLDADESVALGAAWLAANLSDGFKLNRKVGMVDGMPYGVLYQVNALPGAAKAGAVESAEESLFPRLKKFPLKVIRSVKRQPTADFELSFFYDEAQGLPPSWPSASTPILTYHILGLQNATQKYSSYNLTSGLKTNLHFELSRSGIVSLEKAELVVEFSEWHEVRVPIVSNKTTSNTTTSTTTTTNTTDNGTQSSAEKSGEPGKASTTEGGEEADKGKAKNATESGGGGEAAAEEPQFETKMKLRKRTIRPSLEIVDVTEGFQRMTTEAEAKAAQRRIDKLREREAEKKAVAEAKNALEAYIYSTKDKLESGDSVLLEVSTEAQREAVKSALLDAEDWLYMDGDSAGASEFKDKLKEIQKEPEAIFFRQREAKDRPTAVRRAREFVEDTQETLLLWREARPWINHTLHLAPLHEDLKGLETWLSEKEAEQKKLRPHEEAAFNSKTVANRVNTIRERVLRVERIPKPKPKKAPPAKADPASNNTRDNTTESDRGDDDDSPGQKPTHDEL